MQSNPQGVDFLLMDQGNFSEFVSGNQPAVQVYNESRLDVGNYSFSFSHVTTSQNYYLVFKSLSGRNSTTDVMLNMKILTQSSLFDVSFIPISAAVIGVVLVGFGIVVGKPNRKRSKQEDISVPVRSEARCAFCGATIPRGNVFCPSCKRSQL